MMDYKKIFRSKELRFAILRMLSFVPDGPMLRLQYRIKTGRKLNLKNPVRFTEKLQWYKLHYRDPQMVACVDKGDVRDYVEQKGLGHILNGCLGVYDDASQVDFSVLPDRFVVKDTLGSGGESVIVVEDKAKCDLEALRSRMQRWTARPHRTRDGGREWPYYSGKKHRIIIEEYLEEGFGGLTDYKFFCFGGKVGSFFVRTAFAEDHDAGRMTYYDRDMKYLPGVGVDYYRQAEEPLPLPANAEKMIEYAERLAADFPHVRVDFYAVEGRIIFGELTFFHASGYLHFVPDEYDEQLGAYFTLPQKNA